MKKKFLLFICLLPFIFTGCSSFSPNTPTSYDLIDSLQLQMNNVVTTVRGLDTLYDEDYIIAPIYSGYTNKGGLNATLNNSNGLNQSYSNFTNGLGNNALGTNNTTNNTLGNQMTNIDTYRHADTNNSLLGSNTPNNNLNNFGYNYGNFNANNFNNNGINNYNTNGYDGYNNFGYGNYTYGAYNSTNLRQIGSFIPPKNIDTYNINNTLPVNNCDTEKIHNVFNNTTYSVPQTNNTANIVGYTPKYNNSANLNKDTLNAYVSSLEDLYLITSDINSANYILNTLIMNNIELAVAIRNNAFYLNYTVNTPPTENLQVVTEYVNTIETILVGLNATYGYITNEIEAIAPLRDSFYNNTESLNAKYLKLINVIDSRIAQLQNLMVSLQRLNAQLILIANQNGNNNNNNYLNPYGAYYGYNGGYANTQINANIKEVSPITDTQSLDTANNSTPINPNTNNKINDDLPSLPSPTDTNTIEYNEIVSPPQNKNTPAIDTNNIINNTGNDIISSTPINQPNQIFEPLTNDIRQIKEQNVTTLDTNTNTNTNTNTENNNNTNSANTKNIFTTDFNNDDTMTQENEDIISIPSDDKINQEKNANNCKDNKCETNIFIEEYNSDTYFDTNRLLKDTQIKKEA